MTYENMKKHLEIAKRDGNERRIKMYQDRVDRYEKGLTGVQVVKKEVKADGKKPKG